MGLGDEPLSHPVQKFALSLGAALGASDANGCSVRTADVRITRHAAASTNGRFSDAALWLPRCSERRLWAQSEGRAGLPRRPHTSEGRACPAPQATARDLGYLARAYAISCASACRSCSKAYTCPATVTKPLPSLNARCACQCGE